MDIDCILKNGLYNKYLAKERCTLLCVLLFGVSYLAILHMNILQLHLWMVYSYCSDRSTKTPLNTSMETSFFTSLVQLYL